MSDEQGSLGDMSLRAAKRAQVSDQATFHEFAGNGDTTYVGVVRSPDETFLDVVDENIEDLGPPWFLLNEFMSLRDDKIERGMSKTASHNNTWEEIEYGDRFSKYLWWDDSDTESWDEQDDGYEPRSAIIELISRIQNGENIVLVCYCQDDMKCHRKVVRGEADQWLRIVQSLDEKEPAESTSMEDVLGELGPPGEQIKLTDLE